MQTSNPIKIRVGKKIIGDNQRTFIIAEMSANHLGNYELAVKTIHAMKHAGADAVKISTDDPNGGITIKSNKQPFIIKGGTLWDGENLYELYNRIKTPLNWHEPLKKLAEKLGMIFFSTPSCKKTTNFLVKLGVPLLKISSFELVDTNLVRFMASKKLPLIMSTGIAHLSEIDDAVRICREEDNNEIILLKCVSAYPTPLEDANLYNIPTLKSTFNTIVGLSDHTLGISTAIASVALGAKVIEKHFILERKLGGPDASFSLEPQEFKEMVNSIREVEKALGNERYTLTPRAKKGRQFSRSLFIVKDIKKGEMFTNNNIKSIRPGDGILPKYLNIIVGKKAKRNLETGTPLSWDDLY